MKYDLTDDVEKENMKTVKGRRARSFIESMRNTTSALDSLQHGSRDYSIGCHRQGRSSGFETE